MSVPHLRGPVLLNYSGAENDWQLSTGLSTGSSDSHSVQLEPASYPVMRGSSSLVRPGLFERRTTVYYQREL